MQKDNDLKNRFAEFGAEPTDQVWSNLEAELVGKKKKRMALLWWIGASFGVLSLLLTFLFANTLSIEEKTLIAVEKSDAETDPIEVQTLEDASKVKKERSTAKTVRTSQPMLKQSVISKKDDSNFGPIHLGKGLTPAQKLILEEGFDSPQELRLLRSLLVNHSDSTMKRKAGNLIAIVDLNTTTKDTIENNVSQHKDSVQLSGKSEDSLVPMVGEEEAIEKPAIVKIDKGSTLRNKWSYSVHLGAAFDRPQMKEMPSPPTVVSIDNTFYNEEMSSEVVEYSRIDNPIQIQILASYELFKNLNISSGLAYSYYKYKSKSEFETNYNNSLYAHSVVLPVQLNYSYLNGRRISASAGVGYNNVMLLRNSLSSFDYLGSFQLQLGVDYHINSNCSVQIQPHVRNYGVGADLGLKSRYLLGASVGLILRPGIK